MTRPVPPIPARTTGPRSSSAYALAIQDLQHLMSQRRAARAAGGGEAAHAAAPAVEVQTLPDGNHGETLEVAKA